jgi:hypothetical protein
LCLLEGVFLISPSFLSFWLPKSAVSGNSMAVEVDSYIQKRLCMIYRKGVMNMDPPSSLTSRADKVNEIGNGRSSRARCLREEFYFHVSQCRLIVTPHFESRRVRYCDEISEIILITFSPLTCK